MKIIQAKTFHMFLRLGFSWLLLDLFDINLETILPEDILTKELFTSIFFDLRKREKSPRLNSFKIKCTQNLESCQVLPF